LIRPDDHLISSCCSDAGRSIPLDCLLESTSSSLSLYDIDILWADRRVFEIGAMDQSQSSDVADTTKGIFATHGSTRKDAGIIILGEVDYCFAFTCLSRPARDLRSNIFVLAGAAETWQTRTQLHYWHSKQR
jgi:hypothetical protein